MFECYYISRINNRLGQLYNLVKSWQRREVDIVHLSQHMECNEMLQAVHQVMPRRQS
jgi:hypothetical protein